MQTIHPHLRIINLTSEEIVKRKEHSLYAVFILLKQLYVGGAIKSCWKRLDELSGHIGMSRKSTKKYIEKLIKEDFAYMEGQTLRLRSYDWTRDRYNGKQWTFTLKKKGKTFNITPNYKINATNVKEIVLLLRKQVIRDIQMRQHLAVEYKQKKKDRYLANNTVKQNKRKRRIFNDLDFSGVQSGCNVSYQGIARAMGLKYASSSARYIRQLAKEGHLLLQKHAPVFIMNCNGKVCQALKDAFPHRTFRRDWAGNVFYYQPHKMRII